MPAKPTARLLKSVRRLHMYAGLMLVPFVALYGATGLLFNHPSWWSDRDVVEIPADHLALELPPTADLAAEIAAAVPGLAIAPGTHPRLRGRALLESGSDRLVVTSDGARLLRRPARPEAEVMAGLTTADDHAERLLERVGRAFPETQWRLRSMPQVEFIAVRGEERLEASWNPVRETLTLREPEPRSVRSFLLRLHKGHGYPTSGTGASFWWAILVDIMGVMMVVWAASGLLMWWQMKNLRRGGLVALALCAVASTALVGAKWLA